MKWHKLTLILTIVTAVTISFIAPAAPVLANPETTALTSDGAKLTNNTSIINTQVHANPVRIRFAQGATNALVSGSLAANSQARYMLRALSGQLMDVSLSGLEGLSITVTSNTSGALESITSSSTSFRGYLPRTGDTMITVYSGNLARSYSLYVSIPQRISFQTGTTSATLEGSVTANQSHDYILRARAGQIMEINVTPDSSWNNLQLIIYGVDGTVLRSGMGEGSSFRGELPLSEDYIVTVRTGNDAVSYTMNVIIPQRISFAAGADSASVSGRLAAHQSQYYVLRALKDQRMNVNVSSGSEVQLIIYGADGTILMSRTGGDASFSGILPSSQDYVVVVRMDNQAARYTLDVSIR